MSEVYTGGCQCGAVRYKVSRLGRTTICHCRMCQKQTGSLFGAWVMVAPEDLTWTRGEPTWFASSNRAVRGFCQKCGTALSYIYDDDGMLELTIGSFDQPKKLEPSIQANYEQRLPWITDVFEKPQLQSTEAEAFFASVESWQHPDHDTEKWPEDEV